MAAFFYPELDHKTIKNLLIVRQLVDDHSSYFLESPYSQAVEADLLLLLKHTKRPTHVSDPTAGDEIDLSVELNSLYREMKTAKPNASDPDQLGYFRVSTSLMEKILSMQEKVRNMKAMSDHHTLVMDFLQEICSPTQIEEFINRLEEASK